MGKVVYVKSTLAYVVVRRGVGQIFHAYQTVSKARNMSRDGPDLMSDIEGIHALLGKKCDVG